MAEVTIQATAASQRIEGFAQMSPTQRIIALAGRVFTAVDANGRTIKFRPLKAVERMRLKRLAGVDSGNAEFMQDIYTAASITAMGDEVVTFPNSIRECEVIISRLDDVGLIAIDSVNAEMFADLPATQDEAAAQTVTDAKN